MTTAIEPYPFKWDRSAAVVVISLAENQLVHGRSCSLNYRNSSWIIPSRRPAGEQCRVERSHDVG